MAVARFIGVDLAWADARPGRAANETGIVVLDRTGHVLHAGWTRGVEETVGRVTAVTGTVSALSFVDAPLVVDNPRGQRLCDTHVGQRYGRWKVSANSTNLQSPHHAGVMLRRRLEAAGWTYSDGHRGPPSGGRTICECYPYTTLVGAPELGYDDERPSYKRKPRSVPSAQWRSVRASACDELISRLAGLRAADPAVLLDSHPVTRSLLEQPSPLADTAYKHREDLVDALMCAWTAALWDKHGFDRCQVLGPEGAPDSVMTATIIAPARSDQRR